MSNFVVDGTPVIPGPKTDYRPLPADCTADQGVTQSDYNPIRTALNDIRTFLNGWLGNLLFDNTTAHGIAINTAAADTNGKTLAIQAGDAGASASPHNGGDLMIDQGSGTGGGVPGTLQLGTQTPGVVNLGNLNGTANVKAALTCDKRVTFSLAIDMPEISDPSAPSVNACVVYARDTGGKTELVVRFPTGAIQRLAIEP